MTETDRRPKEMPKAMEGRFIAARRVWMSAATIIAGGLGLLTLFNFDFHHVGASYGFKGPCSAQCSMAGRPLWNQASFISDR